MNRKRLRRETICDWKQHYRTFADAEAACMHQFDVSGDVLYAYRCGRCGEWHVGHPSVQTKTPYRPPHDKAGRLPKAKRDPRSPWIAVG